MNTPAIIILAAGASSRLGKAKQLLIYKNKTLLRRTIDESEKINTQVIVVIGSSEAEIKKELTGAKMEVVYNNNWEKGMSSSIIAGLRKALENYPELESCIICVCDQPYISAQLFQHLIDKKNGTDKKIIASLYAGTLGTPVLFDKFYFNDLLQLQGDEGAKKIVKNAIGDVEAVEFENGEVDIDLQSDYEKLVKV